MIHKRTGYKIKSNRETSLLGELRSEHIVLIYYRHYILLRSDLIVESMKLKTHLFRAIKNGYFSKGNVFRKAKKVTFQKVTYFIRQKAKFFLFCMLIVDMMYDMFVVVAWMLNEAVVDVEGLVVVAVDFVVDVEVVVVVESCEKS